MDEARRFFRYIPPGLSFVFESVILIGITSPEIISKAWPHLVTASGLLAATGLLGIPFVGALLAGFHHMLLDYRWYAQDLRMMVNHVPLISQAVVEDRLVVMEDGNCIPLWSKPRRKPIRDAYNPTYEELRAAWVIVLVVWHERVETDLRLKGANARNNSMVDILHGLCASFVGSIVAIGVWALMCGLYSDSPPPAWRSMLVACIAVANVFIQWRTARDHITQVQETIYISLMDTLQSERRGKGGPARIIIPARRNGGIQEENANRRNAAIDLFKTFAPICSIYMLLGVLLGFLGGPTFWFSLIPIVASILALRNRDKLNSLINKNLDSLPDELYKFTGFKDDLEQLSADTKNLDLPSE